MASSASSTDFDEMQDYSAEELDHILQEIEKFEREELEDESDIDIGDDEGEEGEQRDPEDNVSLAMLQATWRPATRPAHVNAFQQPTGPNHTLPDTASPLDYFFLFLPFYFCPLLFSKLLQMSRAKVCRQCVKVGRKTAKGRQVETSYKCSFCQVPLCYHKNDCFRVYHDQNVAQQ